MKKLAIAISATLAATVLAFAGPVEDREALMKERGGLTGQLSKMVKGETPFDAAGALALLEQMKVNADKSVAEFDALWAPGSEGGETAPKAFEDRAGFLAANEKFQADVAAAIAAAPADVAALQAGFGGVAQNCGGCHETYRIKK